MKSFFSDLKPFHDFREITNLENFVHAPEDWLILLTDVQGSTKAIEEGRYRDVNLMGAAAIVAIQNALDSRLIPFTFGGDGATLLIPPQAKENIVEAMLRLKTLALHQFQIRLRTGLVPIKELAGRPVLVGKYQLAEGNHIAVFLGEGFSQAEKMIKAEGSRYEIQEQSPAMEAPDLKNLSCRWSPIPSQNGKMISLLIAARDEKKATEIYAKIIDELEHLMMEHQFNPVRTKNLHGRSLADRMSYEGKILPHEPFLKRLIRLLIATFFVDFTLWTGRNLLPSVKVRQYIEENPRNSDYKKLDGILKMVINCSPEDEKNLQECLQRHYQQGEIFYGIHDSPTATMTCVVHEMSDNHHLHFIDGGDGGYAMAAKMLKQQIKKN